MQEINESETSGSTGLRHAMRTALRPSAVIVAEADRIAISFSDGRVHVLELARYLSKDQVIVAAVHWCKRHGADTIEIGS